MNLENVSTRLERILLTVVQQEERLRYFNEKMFSSGKPVEKEDLNLKENPTAMLNRIYISLVKIEETLYTQSENLETTESFLVDEEREYPES